MAKKQSKTGGGKGTNQYKVKGVSAGSDSGVPEGIVSPKLSPIELAPMNQFVSVLDFVPEGVSIPDVREMLADGEGVSPELMEAALRDGATYRDALRPPRCVS